MLEINLGHMPQKLTVNGISLTRKKGQFMLTYIVIISCYLSISGSDNEPITLYK